MNPGAKGSNFHFQAVCAEAAMACPVPPWYDAVARDHLVFARVSRLQPELTGQLDRRLVRLRAAGEEFHRRVLRPG